MVDPANAAAAPAPGAPAAASPGAAPASTAEKPGVVSEPAATSLLDPSNDQSKTGGPGGSDPNAAANADAAKAGGKGNAESKPGDTKGAPAEYADFTVPQGVVLDPAVVAEFKPLAKELGLTQEAAQKLVTFQSNLGIKAVEQKEKEFSDITKGWAEQTKKELGANYDAERSMAAKGRDKFVTPQLQKLLNESGLGNHPEVFKLFAQLGKAIAEDNLADGKPAGTGANSEVKSTAEVLFSKTTPKK